MPSLLDLANETLYQIIEDIHPNDILNFSLCRKEVHLLAREILQEHKSWQQTYTHVVLHGCHRHQNDSHPLQLIREICMDWKIGEFPKSLRVECCDVDENESDHEDDDKKYEAEKRKDGITTQTIIQDIGSYIREKAMLSAHLPNLVLEELCISINKGYRAAMIGLLLLLLPNLETICFNSYTWNASSLDEILDTVASRDLYGHPARAKALTRLSQIQILGARDNVAGEDFWYLLPFAALPSMRTIFGTFVSSPDDKPMEWPPSFRSSHVTEITLQHSGIEVQHLTQLLSSVSALKRFTYSHNQGLDNDNASMKAHKIIGALLEHAEHSLEYLALTGHCDFRDAEEDKHYNKGSLQGFRVLKEVFLHSDIYVDQVPYDGSSPDPDEGIYGERSKDVIRALVDVLPPSIETVQLVGRRLSGHLSGHLSHLLANLWEQKDLRLPKLNNITALMYYWHISSALVESLTQRCNNIGVRLEVGPEEE